jgi:hypothetical protein
VRTALSIDIDFLRKLGVKPEQRLGLVRAPVEWVRTLRAFDPHGRSGTSKLRVAK